MKTATLIEKAQQEVRAAQANVQASEKTAEAAKRRARHARQELKRARRTAKQFKKAAKRANKRVSAVAKSLKKSMQRLKKLEKKGNTTAKNRVAEVRQTKRPGTSPRLRKKRDAATKKSGIKARSRRTAPLPTRTPKRMRSIKRPKAKPDKPLGVDLMIKTHDESAVSPSTQADGLTAVVVSEEQRETRQSTDNARAQLPASNH